MTDHAEEMRMAEARMIALSGPLVEAIAAGAPTGPIDDALEQARSDYRRAERKHRRAALRASDD